ncbi:MAG: glycosyltransferase family 4 protein [Bacteroidales bacterium]|jgi:glycosyltransferase involved in cell wall biosynthesis|nr:glycosyltransferase family 4 protein [Bacteroidales bacterium]
MPKLLFIRYKKSKDILEGGEQGSQKNYNVLSRILGEDNISVIYVHDENKRKTAWSYLFGIFWFFRGYYFGLSTMKVEGIVAIAQDFDYVFIDRSVFGIIAKKLSLSGYKGQIICFFHNVEVPYFKAKIPKWAPWRPLVLRCVDKNDRYCCQYADKIIALNQRDEKELIKRYRRQADVLVPVAFKDKLLHEPDKQAMTGKILSCLFLGAYFKPNNEGVKWFLQQVYPYVNIKMTIVGKGMSKLKEELAIPKEVEVHSNVPDLFPYFEEADVMIFPIFEGSGMKVKTCESLMYGKNIIATTEAFEGYELEYDKAGGLCNTREEFIAKIREFEENQRPRFNTYSRSQFLEKYSEEVVVAKFEEVLK